jgi:haloalkane dehalogenase
VQIGGDGCLTTNHNLHKGETWGTPTGSTATNIRLPRIISRLRRASCTSKFGGAAHQHYLSALPSAEERKGCYVFPKQIVAATPWLEQLWSKVSVLKDKPALFV